MTVLVTGGSGLVGYEVARMLIERGQEVVCLSRRVPDRERLVGAHYVKGDLNDYCRLFAAIKDYQVTEIVHAGAASGPMVDIDNPYSICHTNISGTVNIYEAARMFNVRRVVYTSSETTYGSVANGPVKEDVAFHPSSVYGVTKVTGDLLGAVYANRYGLDVVALRISWVYGPRRTTDCLLREMIKDALAGRETRLEFGAEQPYQHIYVKDAAAAVVAALETSSPKEHAYNITGGERHTVAEIAAIIRKVIPSARIEVGPGVDPMSDQQALLDISAAARDLGYRPAYSLERGVAEYAEWLGEHSF